jgi:hypothetical protein
MPRFPMSMFPQTKPAIPLNRKGESGYLMATMAILLLVVVALVSTFAFVSQRENRFQGNYATGERLAELAVMAHYYAQQQHYDLGIHLDPIANLYDGVHIVPPDGFNFGPIANSHFSIEIIGRDASPLNTSAPDPVKAASAYIHMRIRTNNGQGRAPSDDVALTSGANFRGMGRIGFYKVGIPTGDKCDGSNTAVRWGPEDSACLNDSEASPPGGIFTDIQKGDIVVPAWETALSGMSTMTQTAMMRYPQPERSDMNIMNADLTMNSNNLKNTTNATMEVATATGTSVIGAANSDPNKQVLLVRGGSTTSLSGGTTMNNGLKVYDQSGAPVLMNIVGSVALNGNVNISQDLKQGAGILNVASANTVNVQSLGSTTTNMTVKPSTNPSFTAAVRTVVQPINGMVLNSPSSQLAVSNGVNNDPTNGTLSFTSGSGTNIYAANMTLNGGSSGSPQIVQSSSSINISSINQNGNGPNNVLSMNHLTVNNCYSTGTACPNVVSDPTGGGF